MRGREKGTMEESLGEGAARVHERLQRRHQQRAEDAQRRKEARESRAVAGEKAESFCEAFNAERASVAELLAGCGGAEAAGRLQEAAARTQRLQKLLNDSVAFLTSHDLSRAQGALRDLQASLAGAREACLPKKKFGFRARPKAPDTPPAAQPDTPTRDTPSEAPPPEAAGSKVDGAGGPEVCGFSDLDGAHLSKSAGEIQRRDVLLSHLNGCRVRLLGSPGTLHLKHIRGCEILCGPVSGSVFVDQCRDSTLAFPCQQLRTHNTTDTRVYLHVTSRAIVEDCSGVAFAPFSWSYPTLEEDFAASGLDRNTNNWDQVDDFNWLAAGTPSPNWTVIPEADRRTHWDP